jgi:hypothetical protein
VFTVLGLFLLAVGLVPFVRFSIFFLQGTEGGHIQSLVFGTAFLVGSLLSFALGVISELLRTNRILLEEQLERVKELQYRQ